LTGRIVRIEIMPALMRAGMIVFATVISVGTASGEEQGE
jgi:hypothetical protein